MEKWIKAESEHYLFHYHKDSIAEKHINEIIKLQEYCFRYIVQVLKIECDIQINYYLCNSSREVGFWAGDNIECNAFAEESNKIFAVFNETVKCIGYHEDAHILSYLIGYPSQVFIREGLAMYFDKNHKGISNLNWTNYYINNGEYIGLEKLILNENFYEISWNKTYPIAGAFTEYMIMRYGIDKYIEFYGDIDYDNLNCICNNLFGKKFSELEEGFIEYIKSLKSNMKICENIN